MTTQGFVATLATMAAKEREGGDEIRYAEFARRLNDGMRRSGVTSRAIVEELEVDDETVRLWRRGKRMPRDTKLRRLATMIGVDPAVLRYGDRKSGVMPRLQGEHVTDEDELALLRAYRGLRKEWAREALRRRAVELLEEFGAPGAENPWRKSSQRTT